MSSMNNRIGTYCVETLRVITLVQRGGGLSPRPMGSRNNLSCFQYRKKFHNTVVSLMPLKPSLSLAVIFLQTTSHKEITKLRTLQSLISVYNQPASSFC